MPYCPRCGVEVDPSVRACPLCCTAIPVFDDLGPGEPAWPTSTEEKALDPSRAYASSSERRARAFLGVAAVFTTAGLAVGAVDLFTTRGVTWSRYPLISLAAGFGLVASALVWHRRPRVWGGTWLLLIAGLLLGLDWADDGRAGWFPTLGLPLAVAPFLLTWLGVVLIRGFRRRGYNVLGVVFSLVTVELLSIDGVVTLWSGQGGWGWSMVASLVLVPMAFLFFFLHFALHRTPDLRRTFHF